MKPKEMLKVLEENGFTMVRSVGSHRRFEDGKGHKVTVPFHNKDLKPGTLNSILRQAGLKQ